MTSPITKGLGVLCVGLLLSTAWYYSAYQKSLADNEILKSNVTTLTLNVEEKQLTIETLEIQQQKLNSNLSILVQSHNETTTSLSQATAEINSLRVKEAERAYEDPFTAGSIAANMFYDRLQSITTKNSNTNKDNQ